MRTLLGLFMLIVLGLSDALGAEAGKKTYYIQLIRGHEAATPALPGSRPIGPKLAAKLRPVFSCQSYFEISRKEVSVAPGQKARTSVSKEREVEIDLSQAGKRKMTIHRDNRPVLSLTRPDSHTMTIVGGERDTNAFWFVVVRRDKPSLE